MVSDDAEWKCLLDNLVVVPKAFAPWLAIFLGSAGDWQEVLASWAGLGMFWNLILYELRMCFPFAVAYWLVSIVILNAVSPRLKKTIRNCHVEASGAVVMWQGAAGVHASAHWQDKGYTYVSPHVRAYVYACTYSALGCECPSLPVHSICVDRYIYIQPMCMFMYVGL